MYVRAPRRVNIKNSKTLALIKTAKKVDYQNVLRNIFNALGTQHTLVIQAELLGPSIQGNKYKLKDYELKAFNLISDEVRLPQDVMEQHLSETKIGTVHVIAKDYVLPATIDELVDFSIGTSTLYNCPREGIVLRNYEKDIYFKCINPEFLLKYDD